MKIKFKNWNFGKIIFKIEFWKIKCKKNENLENWNFGKIIFKIEF